MSELPTKQARAVELLTGGHSRAATARIIGVDKSAITRWMRTAEFREAVDASWTTARPKEVVAMFAAGTLLRDLPPWAEDAIREAVRAMTRASGKRGTHSLRFRVVGQWLNVTEIAAMMGVDKATASRRLKGLAYGAEVDVAALARNQKR